MPSAICSARNFDVVRVGVALEDAGDGRGGVRVRGRDEDVVGRDAGGLAAASRLASSMISRGIMQLSQTTRASLRRAVVEHEAAGVQPVVGRRWPAGPACRR